MPEAKKAKIKVREIKPKIKLIEPEAKEQPVEKEQEGEETQLEEIITDAPSSREFSVLRTEPVREGRERPSEPPSPAAAAESEASSGTRYAIQGDISEAEIRKIYQSRIADPRRIGAGQQISVPEIRDTKALFRNREIEAARTEQEEEKYARDIEPKAASPKRRFPWEA